MSNAEEIAEEIVEELRMPKSVRNNKRQEIQMVASMMQAHTNATLQELKERVNDMYYDLKRYPDKEIELIDRKDVIKTIEDMQDE